MIGIVYYRDDPHKRVFRTVHLVRGETEAELDNPDYVTLGVDPDRVAVLEKVESDDPRRKFSGTPWTKTSDPWPPVIPVGFSPSSPAIISAAFDMVALRNDDVLIDLGSGDGAVVIAAALRGATAIGIETDAELIERAYSAAATTGVSIDIRKQDFREADILSATVIFMNVGDVANTLTKKPIAKGTRIVTVDGETDLGEPQKQATVDGCTLRMWAM